MKSRLLGTTALALGLMVGLGGTALAGQPTATSFFAAGEYQRTIEGVINVCESGQQECTSVGSVRVKLFKKKDGEWVRIAVKPAERQGQSWYVSFDGAPRAGRCKMTAIFSGTNTLDPSRGSISGGCSEENWM